MTAFLLAFIAAANGIYALTARETKARNALLATCVLFAVAAVLAK